MSKFEYPAGVLPDMELYGGDTTAWKILLCHLNGKPYETSEITGYSCVLTITPFVMGKASDVEPVLTKTATVIQNAERATALFEFQVSDTINLSGKYVYQIELNDGTHARVGQGYLFFRRNNNVSRGGLT